MGVISIDDAALYKLIDELANRVNLKNNSTAQYWSSSKSY